ncbi:MAG: hypothetical protein ACPIOQ_11540 [Promethearchaeia archaeon]
MAAPQGCQGAAGDCCAPGSGRCRQPAAQTFQLLAPCSPAAARLAPLLSAAAACSANEPSASGTTEEATAGALLLLHSSSNAPAASAHKRDTPASGQGGSGASRKKGRPPRPKPSDMPPMRVISPVLPASLPFCGWGTMVQQAEEPSLVVVHEEDEHHVQRLAEQTAIVVAQKRRQVRPSSPEPVANAIPKCINTGFWPSHVFFPGQPGGPFVKNPLDHRSIAAVKLYDCRSTRCREGGCCTKLTELEVLEVRQEHNNGSACSPSSCSQKLRAVVQTARNDQVKGGYDTVKISLKSGNPVTVCLPAWALIAGYTGAVFKKVLHEVTTTPAASLVPFEPQLHPREQEAQDIQLVRSYIHDVLVNAHEHQPVASLGCSSGKQTCLTKRPWKARPPPRTALEPPFSSSQTAQAALTRRHFS